MNKQRTLNLLVACSVLLGGSATAYATQTPQAQSVSQGYIKASGTVTDSNGEPLIGASVKEKGAKTGVSTDIDGKFTISVKPGTTLEISYVGCKNAYAKASSSMQVTLEQNSEILNDIVIVGYGTQRRENLTGAVASVDIDKTLAGRQIPDIGRGLQGTTAGLNIVMPDSEVGSDPNIKIRGQIGSINGSSAPLILMDNVEIPSIQVVNPDDIESISVLKDAASSSIYGAKAAFGVILITTKKGAKTDRVDVTYSGNFAWQNISKKMEMGTVDASQYRVDALKRSNGTRYGAFWIVDEETLEKQREWAQTYGGTVGVNDPFTYGRDWYQDAEGFRHFIRSYDPYDYMIREWAPSMTHNVSVNGKAGKTQFNVSLGYLDQNGIIKPAKKDDFRRYNAAARVSTELSKWLTFRVGMNYSLRNKRYAYANGANQMTSDPWYYMYRWDAYQPFGTDENGRPLRSPATEIALANTANRENSYLNTNVGMTVNLTDNWHINLDYTFAKEDLTINRPGTKFTMANTWEKGIERLDADGNQVYVNSAGQVVAADAPGAMKAYDFNYYQITADGSGIDHIRREGTNAKRHTLNITMDYDWKINDANNIKALIGMNRADWESKQHWAQITNLTDITSPSFDKTNGTQTSSGNFYWDGQLGFFARVNYSLLDRYLVEANVRHDGSSKFPGDLKWRTFPSFSLGWRLDQEEFMKWWQPVVSSFKIRGSWGMIGDQSVSSSLYIPTMSQSQGTWLNPDGSKVVIVGTPAAVAGDVTWQDILTTDIGFDARLFNNELGISFDWYQRDTKNMLVPAEGVPVTFGAGAPKGNYGNLRTRGWEITIDYNHAFNKDLSVNASLTFADAITHITKYGTGTSVTGYYNGKEYGEIWGYTVDRLYQKSDFVWGADGKMETVWVKNGKIVDPSTVGAKEMNKLADPDAVYQDRWQTGSIKFGPGDVKYADLDGSGEISNGYENMIKLKGKYYLPGDPGYEEALKNPEHKKVATGTTENHGDLRKIGNSTPRFEYGIRLGINYKDFDFSIFGQGIGSRKIWGKGPLAIPGYDCGDGAIPQAIASDYWTESNTDAFYPAPYNMGQSNTGFNMLTSDRYLLNMAYFRIKNITLGYTLPRMLTQKIHINRARFYVACENFFTFDKLRGLPIDPEVISGQSMWHSGGNYNLGRTGVGAPAMKNVNVGIQLNF